MNIEIVSYTQNPIEVISLAAGTSWGKDDTKESRVLNCYKQNHMGVFEHASFTVKIYGISRACSHQLVRHRIASFCQESQRYVEVEGDDWYVRPNSFVKEEFDTLMDALIDTYKAAIEAGIKKEDARYLLPEATKTNITMTMNLSSFYHFLDLRTKKNAQWEIRNLAWSLLEAVRDINDQWEQLITMWVLFHDSKNREVPWLCEECIDFKHGQLDERCGNCFMSRSRSDVVS